MSAVDRVRAQGSVRSPPWSGQDSRTAERLRHAHHGGRRRQHQVMTGSMSGRSSHPAERTPLVVIAGPTASGKSALAIRIAETFGGTVINADAMQVYADLEVLTARPGPAELERAPHRLFGDLPLASPCSVGLWRNLACGAIAEAREANRVPIVCGGTGFYIHALLHGITNIPDIPATIRLAAAQRHARLGGRDFRRELARHDSVTAARLPDGDRQRLLRAWEVLAATGRTLADWQSDTAAQGSGVAAFSIVLMPERGMLYRACDRRFLAMLEAGAIEEARRIMAQDLDPALPGLKALGLRQLTAYLQKQSPLEAAIADAQRATRHYAKRQCTWFRNQMVPDILQETPFSQSAEDELFPRIRQFLLSPFG